MGLCFASEARKHLPLSICMSESQSEELSNKQTHSLHPIEEGL